MKSEMKEWGKKIKVAQNVQKLILVLDLSKSEGLNSISMELYFKTLENFYHKCETLLETDLR